jgi:hypothetical protein
MYRAHLVVAASLVITLITAQSQTATFDRQQYPAPPQGEILTQADLNSDGAQDVLIRVWAGTDRTNDGLWVYVSNGDGSFRPGAQYQPGHFIGGAAVEDFNEDGRGDVVFTDGYGAEFAAGNGDGSLGEFHLIPSAVHADNVATADFNRDGHLDIIFSVGNQLFFAAGDGHGAFGSAKLLHTGQFDFTSFPTIVIGDFDGDTRADFAAVEESGYDPTQGAFSKTVFFYGNGDGTFTVKSVTVGGTTRYVMADLNHDGKSDLVGTYVQSSVNTHDSGVHIIYGNSSRTFGVKTFGVDDLTPEFANKAPVAVADYNGDGRLDLAVPSTDRIDSFLKLGIYFQQSNGSFVLGERTPIASVETNDLAGAIAGDYDGNNEPDVVTIETNGVLDYVANSSSGSFPSCRPTSARSIVPCSPVPSASHSALSPLQFKVAASSLSPMRKLEVWVDGIKRIESYNVYDNLGFLTGSVALSEGTHKVSYYAVNYDNRAQRVTQTINVGSATTACVAPSTAGINVCAPIDGSSVNSSVHVSAVGSQAPSPGWSCGWMDRRRLQLPITTSTPMSPLRPGGTASAFTR